MFNPPSIRPEIKKDLYTIASIPLTVIKGWQHIFKNVGLVVFNLWYKKPLQDRILSGTLFLQFVLSLTGWIGYKMNFGSGTENLAVSVKPNIYFILISLINLVMMEFYKRNIFIIIAIFLQLIAVALLTAGAIFPQPFFVDFLEKGDYYFRFTFYLFAVLIIINLISFFTKLKRE